MKISVLALDYDGTIARNDELDPAVRDAIATARTAGITVLLATGRSLSELRRVAGELHFVDAVVAENGAVVHFPEAGYTSLLAPPIPPEFVAELRRRGVPCQPGQCLVDAHANDAARILDVIRALEAPLVLLFNRSRVMTLPQGVSKATGLHAALDMIRASARNTVAIGDAENDHELLRLSELGAAVDWGSAQLKAAADVVVAGKGPPAVADYIRSLAATGRLPLPARARRRLTLGHSEDGREFSLKVRGRNVLIAGDAKSGKSWVAGLLCEQLIFQGYCVCVIDPEGDYRSLEALPGVAVLGGEDPPPTPRELLRALRYPDRSVVIDLSKVPHDAKIEYIRAVLPAMNAIRRRTGLPHRILIDEAHYFLHDQSADLLDLDYNGYIVITYRASRLSPQLVAHTDVMIVTCESNPVEIAALRDRCRTCQQVSPAAWSMLSQVKLGQAVALPVTEEAGGELRLFTIGSRLTPHVRHRQKYVDVPVTEQRAFRFAPNGRTSWASIRTLRQFVEALESLEPSHADAYIRRGDFSRWIGDVFGDHALAAEIRAHEERYLRGEHRDTLPEMAGAIRSRYDLTGDDSESFLSDEPQRESAG
jgi:hydroxymethylpyrimidine pyrophosphatase-like HAD family hydrolase